MRRRRIDMRRLRTNIAIINDYKGEAITHYRDFQVAEDITHYRDFQVAFKEVYRREATVSLLYLIRGNKFKTDYWEDARKENIKREVMARCL